MKRILVFAFTLLDLSGWCALATPGPGCDTSRSAVAYHSDGTVLSDPSAPVPCAVKTGFGGAETRVAVAPNGDVLQTPAIVRRGLLGTPVPAGHLPGAPTPEFVFTQNSGIGWSRDRGASWQLVKANGNFCPQGDNDLYFDRMTGRLFYSCIFGPLPPPANDFAVPYGPAAALLTSPASPAGYIRWDQNTMYGWLSENPRFTSAPAPAGQTPPKPGENMSYWCANLANANEVHTRTCHRSFDGGASWEFASALFSEPVPQHTECGTNAESFSGGYPQGGPDGSLWVMVQCGGNNYLARSTDEASTWPLVQKADDTGPVTMPGAPSQLRVDSAGNLYALERGVENPDDEVANAILLRVSTDGGQTWSAPLDMTAPAARDAAPPPPSSTPNPFGLISGSAFRPVVPSAIRSWYVALGYGPGEVAVSYLVSRPDGAFDGYVSVTYDALAGEPVIYGASINDPAKGPIVTAPNLSDDFITLDVGPDGTPWAGFFSDCATDANGNYTDAYCKETGGTRLIPYAPPVMPGAVKTLTMGSLQRP